MIRPPRLRRNDRIAALTLSWGGPGTFPHRYEAGVRQFEEALELEIVELEHTRADPHFLADHPEARLADLHAALSDRSIAGIISTIGGDDSIRLLPDVDLDLIRSHPKPIIGYSDTTTLHMACRRAGAVSFYGPSLMTGFAENAGLHEYLVDGFRSVLFESEGHVWPRNEAGWTVEMLDWDDPANQDRKSQLRDASAPRWSGSTSPASGTLVAGCLEVLDWLRGSRWFPPLDGAILALETSEEGLPPEGVARFLRSLAAAGELQGVAAILFGRPGGADVEVGSHGAYDDAIERVVLGENGLDIPVVTRLDFGHTDPIWTLPIGVDATVDPRTRTISFGPGVS